MRANQIRRFISAILLSAFLATSALAANTTTDIRLDVKQFSLKNGMLFLVVNRPATPQVACRLAIRAGSALETSGKTGIAHMLEHMMFKGTKNVGTRNWQKDLQLQTDIEAAYQIIAAERRKRIPDLDVIRIQSDKMARLRKEVQDIYIPQAFSSQLGKNGAVDVNAFTTRDQTQFVLSIPSDMIEQWFSIVSEQIFEPAWREFYVEKEVVQREWAFRYVNNPNGAAMLDLYDTAYTAHPYRNPVIGWKSDMKNFSTTTARQFHDRYYHPNNAVCVLVGDITVKKARQLAEIYFSRYPAGRRAPETVTAEPVQKGPVERIRYLKGARTPIVRIGFHGAAMGSDDFFALDALTMILSAGRSARLTQEIVNKGLAARAWAYNPDNRYGGMVILGGSPIDPPASATTSQNIEKKQATCLTACRQVRRLLLAQTNQLKTTPVSARELARLIKLNRRDFIDRLRSNEDLAGTLATLEVQIGWRYLDSYLDRMARVTPEMVQAAARKYLREDNCTTVYVIPGGKPAHPPEPYREERAVGVTSASRLTRPTDLTNHSIYPTPAGWHHPLSFLRQPQKILYPPARKINVNDTRLFYLPDRELPIIDVALIVKAGAVDIPRSKTGLANLLSAAIVRGGAGEYSPAELARILDENAIQLSVDIGREASEVHLSVLKDDWQKGLALLTAVLTAPRFDADVLKTTKAQMLTGLARQGGDARSVARREWFIWHFAGHPYGRDPLTGLKTIPKITRSDLTDFLARYFVPENMVVAVSGDISETQAAEGLKQLLGTLSHHPPPRRDMAPPADTPPVLALINKPGQVQSQIIMGTSSIGHRHPDFWKLRLLINILGGNDSLLSRRLRDDLGLVYATGFYQIYRWQAGILLGYIGCRGDKTGQAVAEAVNTIRQLSKKVPQSDFKLKKLDALNSFVFNVDSPDALVTTYGNYALRGDPLDTLAHIQAQFIQTRYKDMRRLARAYLDTSRLQIIIVADKTIPVTGPDGTRMPLASNLKQLAGQLGLPFREIDLR